MQFTMDEVFVWLSCAAYCFISIFTMDAQCFIIVRVIVYANSQLNMKFCEF